MTPLQRSCSSRFVASLSSRSRGSGHRRGLASSKSVRYQLPIAAPAQRAQHGFTLMELLITITIMGILAAVAVFGAGDYGTTNGCKSDAQTLRNAESSFYSSNGRYGTQAELVAANVLRSASVLHDVQISGLSYTVTETGKCQNQGTADSSVVAAVATTQRPGLTVFVTSANGAPIVNVAITYRQDAGEWVVFGTTDATGLVNGPLASGNYDIQATLLGATNVVPNVVVNPGTLVVLSTVALTVRLRDSLNAGIAGGDAEIVQTGGSTPTSIGSTAANGDVVAQVLPATYDVSMTFAGVTATKTSTVVAQSTTVLFQTTTLTVHMTNTTTGADYPGVSVVIKPQTGAAYAAITTNAKGLASREVLSGSYDVTASYTVAGESSPRSGTVSAVPVGSSPVVVEMQGQ